MRWKVLIIGLCCFASATVSQQAISAVAVSGNYIFSDQDILTMAHVRTQPGRFFDPTVVHDDALRIMSLGSFSRVTTIVDQTQLGLRVVFCVSENPIITSVNLLSRNGADAEMLKSLMHNQAGAQVYYSAVDQDVQRLNRFFKRQGYELSAVAQMTLITDNVLEVKLIEPRIQSFTISGNTYTNEELLLRECETRPGLVYNAKQLQIDRTRLFSLGYFSTVSLPEVLPGRDSNSVVVGITVKEKKKNTINVGLGVSSKEEFGFARLNLLNTLGTREQLQFSIQSGREYRGTTKYPKTAYRFRYFNPWIFQRDLSLGYTRYLNSNYESLKDKGEVIDVIPVRRDGFSFDMGFPLPFGREYRFVTEYKDESVLETNPGPRVQYINRSISGMYLYNGLSFLDQTTIYNDGEYFSLRLEKGGALRAFDTVLLGLGGVEFTRVDLKYNRYYALTGDNHILGLNYRAGTFVSSQKSNVLEGEQYTVGGSTTVRGYADIQPFAIGPKMVVINCEYTYLFTPGIQGVLFYDWGNAFESVNVSVKDFKSGAGVGMRFSTAVGPIRFDLGRGEKYWVLHFGLGYMF